MTDRYRSHSNRRPRTPPLGPRSDYPHRRPHSYRDQYERPGPSFYRPTVPERSWTTPGRSDEPNMNKRRPSRSPEGTTTRKAPRASPRDVETPNSPASSSTAAGQDFAERRQSRHNSVERESTRRRSYVDSPTNIHANDFRSTEATGSRVVPVLADPRLRNRTPSMPVAHMLPDAHTPTTTTNDNNVSDVQNPVFTMLLQFGDQVANVAKLEISRDQSIARLRRAEAEQARLKPSFTAFPAFKEQSTKATVDAQNVLDRLEAQLAQYRKAQAEAAQTLASVLRTNETRPGAAPQSHVTRKEFDDSQLKSNAMEARWNAVERRADSLAAQMSKLASKDTLQRLQEKTEMLENKTDTIIESEAKALRTVYKAEPKIDQATRDTLHDHSEGLSALRTTVTNLKTGHDSLSTLIYGSEEGELVSSERTAKELGGTLFESVKSMKARLESTEATQKRFQTALNTVDLLRNFVLDGDNPLVGRVNALDDFAFKGSGSARKQLDRLATTMGKSEAIEGGPSLLARVDQLQQDIKSLEKVVGSLREERDKSQHTSHTSSEKDLDHAQGRIASMEAAIDDLRKDLEAKVESQGEEFAAHDKKIESQLAELSSSLTAELDRKLRQANKPTMNGTTPTKPAFVAPPSRTAASPVNGMVPPQSPGSLVAMNNDITNLKLRYDGMSTALNSLKFRYDNLTTDALAQQMLSQLGREAGNIEKVKNDAIELRQYVNTGFERITHVAEGTAGEVSNLRGAVTALSNRVDKHEEDHAGDVFNTATRVDALTSSLDEHGKSITRVHTKLNETNTALDKSNDKIASVKEEVGSVKEILDHHDGLLNYGEREIPRMQKQLDENTADICELRTQAATFKAEQKVAKPAQAQGQGKGQGPAGKPPWRQI